MKITETVLLCIDTETTGLDIEADRIIELGGAYAVAGERGPTFRTLVNPGIPIPAEATSIHGIGDADVAAALPWSGVGPRLAAHVAGEVAEQLDPWCSAPLVVGYNVLGFDGQIINAEQRRANLPEVVDSSRVLDPFVWIRWFQREGFPADGRMSSRLADVCAHFGIGLDRAHSADADAVATLALLLRFVSLDMICDDIDMALTQQAGMADAIAWERSRWGHYLYVDRGYFDVMRIGSAELDPAELRIGFGKNSGKRLVDCRGYAKGFASRFGHEMPELARVAFEGAVRGGQTEWPAS